MIEWFYARVLSKKGRFMIAIEIIKKKSLAETFCLIGDIIESYDNVNIDTFGDLLYAIKEASQKELSYATISLLRLGVPIKYDIPKGTLGIETAEIEREEVLKIKEHYEKKTEQK